MPRAWQPTENRRYQGHGTAYAPQCWVGRGNVTARQFTAGMKPKVRALACVVTAHKGREARRVRRHTLVRWVTGCGCSAFGRLRRTLHVIIVLTRCDHPLSHELLAAWMVVRVTGVVPRVCRLCWLPDGWELL